MDYKELDHSSFSLLSSLILSWQFTLPAYNNMKSTLILMDLSQEVVQRENEDPNIPLPNVS